MRLSILDQAPISSGQTAREALIESMKLAQAGERFGYTRYWIAEHHDLSGLACSAPEIMLSFIGANTKHIIIGSGAVLLPHYKPYKVAEVFHMLATLFPGRVDVGIGRAPGGSAEATNALSDHFLQNMWKMPELLAELLQFIDDKYTVPDNPYANLSAAPIPKIAPTPWLLGTGRKSAELAAANGLPYAFGRFMSDQEGTAIIEHYKSQFQPRKRGQQPEVILTVSCICADSDREAEELALSSLIWSIQKEKGEGHTGVPSLSEAKQYSLTVEEKDQMVKLRKNMVVGNPRKVVSELRKMKQQFQVDEIMIVTITHSPQARLHSYQLIMEEINKKPTL